VDGQSFRVNRTSGQVYEEVAGAIPPVLRELPRVSYSFEVDFAEREGMVQAQHRQVLGFCAFREAGGVHQQVIYVRRAEGISAFGTRSIEVYGAVTLRGSYTKRSMRRHWENLRLASTQNFPIVGDPFSTQTEPQLRNVF